MIFSDFDSEKPPTFCGVDNDTGDEKFCCVGEPEEEMKPMVIWVVPKLREGNKIRQIFAKVITFQGKMDIVRHG